MMTTVMMTMRDPKVPAQLELTGTEVDPNAPLFK
jgi:hypothetical protein